MKIHPRSFYLKEFASSLSEEHRAMMKHLVLCAHCRERLSRVLNQGRELLAHRLAEVLPWPSRTEAEYTTAIAAAERQLLVRARAIEVERVEAPARLAELLEQPSERREMLVRNHPRFQTWGLLERLIESAKAQFFVDPESAESFARLALCLANALDAGYYGVERIEDLKARTWGYLGNIRRIRFELRSAERAFATASTHLRRGTGDPLERALFFELRASLLRAQRRFEAAERLLLRALRVYRQVGETRNVGRVLVSMSILLERAGEPERAIPLLQEALERIDGELEPRLLWQAHHNLITVLVEAGRFMEALGLFIQARPLYARFRDGHTQNRRHWVAGRISRGLGQTEKAEAHLQTAREGFCAEGAVYDSAVVSLDLAALYAEQGRTSELKQLAEEMLAIFSSQQIHREALAALSFLHQAVLAERASLEMVTGVAGFLKRLQHDPNLSFAQPTSDQ